MIRKYTFHGEGTIEFDDEKSVRELIQKAFEEFDYYEPAGMDIVTVFQSHHSDSYTGWFTTDVNRSCADEIEDRDWLCFAYFLPNIFYFAEGGWGHHMPELGNHPEIPDAVSLNLSFEDFDNTVVINGNYCFKDIIRYLMETEYIPENCSKVLVDPVGIVNAPYEIAFDDPIMSEKLTRFEEYVEERTEREYEGQGYVYHVILKIC